jgi:hypothetical protein
MDIYINKKTHQNVVEALKSFGWAEVWPGIFESPYAVNSTKNYFSIRGAIAQETRHQAVRQQETSA